MKLRSAERERERERERKGTRRNSAPLHPTQQPPTSLTRNSDELCVLLPLHKPTTRTNKPTFFGKTISFRLSARGQFETIFFFVFFLFFFFAFLLSFQIFRFSPPFTPSPLPVIQQFAVTPPSPGKSPHTHFIEASHPSSQPTQRQEEEEDDDATATTSSGDA